MKGILTISFVLYTILISAQTIAIQEVLYAQPAGNDKFELVNTTSGTINVSSYFICSAFIYYPLSSVGAPPATFQIIQGSLNMLPGAHLKMKFNSVNLNNTQGDFCVYTGMCFGCAADMLDFMQYGSTDPFIGRGYLAVQKGIWSETSPGVLDFVPTVSNPTHSTNWDGTNGGAGQLTLSTDFLNGPPTLPIGLLTLSGRVNMHKQIDLDWTVLDEINSEKHQVEKSADGVTYSVIGEINSKNLGPIPGYYHFLDKSPALNGGNYYRIRQVDFDGAESLSSTFYLKVKDIPDHDIVISPSPMSGGSLFNAELYWQKDDAVAEFRIVDMEGRVVDRFTKNLVEGYNLFMQPLKNLAPGQYLMILSDRDGDHTIERFIVGS